MLNKRPFYPKSRSSALVETRPQPLMFCLLRLVSNMKSMVAFMKGTIELEGRQSGGKHHQRHTVIDTNRKHHVFVCVQIVDAPPTWERNRIRSHILKAVSCNPTRVCRTEGVGVGVGVSVDAGDLYLSVSGCDALNHDHVEPRQSVSVMWAIHFSRESDADSGEGCPPSGSVRKQCGTNYKTPTLTPTPTFNRGIPRTLGRGGCTVLPR